MLPYALFAHLLSVAALFAAVGIEAMTVRSIQFAGSIADLRSVLRTGSILKQLFPTATLAVIATGVLLTALEGQPLTQGWLAVSVSAVIFVSVFGSVRTGARMAALARAAFTASGNEIDAATRARQRDPRLIFGALLSAGEACALVYLMILKPNFAASLEVVTTTAAVAGCAAALTHQHSMRVTNDASTT
jgi:uncharacterized membrane protein